MSTALAFSVSSAFSADDSCRAFALPCLNIRKRSINSSSSSEEEESQTPSMSASALPCVNSAFLGDLFADVAEIEADQGEDEGVVTDESSSSSISEASTNSNLFANAKFHHGERFPVESRLQQNEDDARPLKKSRLSRNSFVYTVESSPKAANEFFYFPEFTAPAPTSSLCLRKSTTRSNLLMAREDSLAFQLQCVSSTDDESEKKITEAASKIGELVFPHLPATISNSSCDKSNTKTNYYYNNNNLLTRNVSDLQSSLSSGSNNNDDGEPTEYYGWFVELEKGFQSNSSSDTTSSDPSSTSYYAMEKVSDLAFVAPTAPAAANFDEEVEWAKAADTVDDVLADFF